MTFPFAQPADLDPAPPAFTQPTEEPPAGPPAPGLPAFLQPADDQPTPLTPAPAPPPTAAAVAQLTGHTPTPEQQATVEAFAAGGNLVIEAGAGSGKTSSLKMVAAIAGRRRGTYIAFNRAIADDARRGFTPWVNCATAHSLAFRAIGNQFGHRLNGPRVPARETARLLRITSTLKTPGDRLLTPSMQARMVSDTVTRFCYGDTAQIEPWHVPRVAGLDDHATVTMLRAELLPYARRMWDDLGSPDGQLRFQHDHYLKMWQLSGPVLPADYVMLDEAQDANPVIAAIVAAQGHAQRILVGDRAQAIYGWRGARDAMAGFDGTRLRLSQSFRFGDTIAREANKWLAVLDTGLRLTGYDQITSTIGPLDEPAAILCRGNSETVRQVMAALTAGKRAALVGGGREVRRLAEAAVTLKAGKGCSHPELYAFKTWGELQEYVEQDSEGSDLKTFVKLVDEYGPEVIIDVVENLVVEQHADVTVSTVHKAKGREWTSVRIANDFPRPKAVGDDGEDQGVPADDAMLAYVAVTRAREGLDRTGLAWIDHYTEANRG
ncbi:UvrD-helicase domain-containing protein [Actinomadura sp. DC4]|uniref:UvrD-helicase domain-containing protein n=1 Tax=Actinomadura sp. DC4 TaxID=3055069 RepID=UPI0025AF2CEE|nr:UvrD-helicase domain-containing protein [Actinomadura sp. DC4]MDN3356057.1 UvrD-helicase domain-containing protein [Actinomadura sp. DC4]